MKFILDDDLEWKERFQGERVLIADDDRMWLEVANILLEDKGLVVDTVMDGELAMERYLQSEEYTYTAVFLDIHMMKMNGYDVARQIRQSGRRDSKEIGVYAMSADFLLKNQERIQKAGMNGYIMKPVNYKKLFQIIRDEIAK